MGGIPGAGIVKNGVNAVKDKVVDTGKKVVDTGKKVVDHGADAVKDTVEFSKDAAGTLAKGAGKALEFKANTELDFAKGVFDWGKSTFDTAKGIVTHPVETAKAVGNLATNPVLNPVLGIPKALIEGKNPVEAYKDGANQLKDIGTGLYNDYKEEYKKNGIAGLAGFIAPDVAIAVLSGGSSAGAKGAGTAAAKGVAKEVAEETLEHGVATGVAREVAEKSTGREIAKEIAKEVAPGPGDIADGARKAEQPRNDKRFSFLDPVTSLFDGIF